MKDTVPNKPWLYKEETDHIQTYTINCEKKKFKLLILIHF